MSNFVKSVALAALMVGASTGASAATNLVQNGSFESGFANWLPVSSTGVTPGNGITIISTGVENGTGYGDNVTVKDGLKAAYFVDDGASQSLSQSIALTAGTYKLDFSLFATKSGAANPYGFSLVDSVGGNILASNMSADVPVGVWTDYGYTFSVASNASYLLNFQFLSGPTAAKDVVLDAVSITAVPEPSTWAMMIGGLGLVGVALRRRKSTVSFA